MKKSLYIIPFLILTATQTKAQALMGVKDCMQYAVENSKKIAAENENLYKAELTKRDALLYAFTPSITASASAYYTNGRTPNPETNMYTELKMIQDQYRVNGSITLFNGFEAVNNIKMAKLAVMSGKESAQIKTDEICLSTMQAFFNYTYYAKMCNVAEKQLETASESLRKAEREYQLGDKSYQNVLEHEAFKAEAEYTLAEYTANRNAAMMLLKKMMFYPVEDELQIDTSATVFEAAPQLSDAAATAQFAKENNSESIISKNDMQIKLLNMKTALWQLLPRVDLSAGWSSSHSTLVDDKNIYPPFKDQIKNNASRYIGVDVNIPIFNHLGKFSEIKRRKADYRIASYEYDDKQREIENEVYAAYDEATSSMKTMLAAQKSAALYQVYYNAAKTQYELGTISYIDFNTAYNKLLENEAKFLNAMFAYRIKNAVVEYYRGKSYIEQF